MIRACALAASLALLTACGVDGPPIAPAQKTEGLTITGEATFGLARNGAK